jgi:hypothetical protein
VIPGTALSGVLSKAVLERLEEQSRILEAFAPLSGRWLPAEGDGVVLQVLAGRTVVAELLDADGNGRVDLVLLNAGLRQENPRRAE